MHPDTAPGFQCFECGRHRCAAAVVRSECIFIDAAHGFHVLCATWLLQCDLRGRRTQPTDDAAQNDFASVVKGKPRRTLAGGNAGRRGLVLHAKWHGNAADADQITDQMPARSDVSQRGKQSLG